MSTPHPPPYGPGPQSWTPPPTRQQPWGAPPQPGWQPGGPPTASGGGRNPVLPLLAVAVAVVALVASLLPYYRIEVTEDSTVEYTGWQQRYSGPSLPDDSLFLAHGITLLLACAVLVAGAVVVLAARARPIGTGLLATGAGMVLSYTVFLLADLVNAAAEETSATSSGPGTWLLTLAGLGCIALVVLSLVELGRRAR